MYCTKCGEVAPDGTEIPFVCKKCGAVMPATGFAPVKAKKKAP